GLQYVAGVQSSMTVWEPGKQPLPAKPRGKMGRPPRLLQRSGEHQPVSVKQLAMSLPSTAYKHITWREGTDRKLQSRFAAVRVRAAHRDRFLRSHRCGPASRRGCPGIALRACGTCPWRRSPRELVAQEPAGLLGGDPGIAATRVESADASSS